MLLWRPRRVLVSLIVTTVAVLAPGAEAATTTSIRVNGTTDGRRFDGVGAVSAGGSSRYLIDYPPTARNAILDYLFKPNYGAALQILKVEIGGDADSSDGAEASIEHRRGVVDCNAGYEFWLMREAKARNPAIRLYALAWAAPGWTGSFWSDNTITAIVDWLACARRHGLRIDYLGGTQNERRHNRAWTRKLRASLDSAGFGATKIVMSDTFDRDAKWAVANHLAHDAAFRSVTSVIGNHDVCGYPTTGYSCTSTATARKLRIPLWASELGGMDGNAGAESMARAVIRGYSTARLVGYITWPIVQATPPSLPRPTFGLIHAKQPWSGNYQVNAMTYAIAMTSWFTAPGWRYVNGANGRLDGSFSNGSYTTLRSATARDWTTIAETTTTGATQHVKFRITGGLAAARVRVWRSRLSSTDPASWMVRRADIHPVRRRFSFGLLPGYVYTFTTLARSAKGTATPPPAQSFGPYVEQPGAMGLHNAPLYLAPLDGAFQYQACATDSSRQCTQQMAPQPPVYWRQHAGFPYAVIGDETLQDYTVSCDVLFTHAGSSAGVIGRLGKRGRKVSSFRGYLLTLDDRGAWQLIKNSIDLNAGVLASGTLVAWPGVGTWHNLSLTVEGATLTGAIDGQPIISLLDPDPAYASGLAGIEAGANLAGAAWTGTSWPIVQYRRLTVTPSTVARPPSRPPRRGAGTP